MSPTRATADTKGRSARDALWPPGADATQVLRAGLWPADDALESWNAWEAGGARIETADHGLARLMPLVHRNIGDRVGEPDASLLLRAFRSSWMANQYAIRAAATGLEILAGAGLPTMALKGASLQDTAYLDRGSRPMGDFDVAVPSDRIPEAIAALTEAGLVAGDDDDQALMRARHSAPFVDPEGFELDLHREVLWRPGLEEALWDASVPIEIGGIQTRALCPADALLHVCVHGAPWNPVRPVRWAADAYKVIETAGDSLDWDRLVRLAERGGLTLPMAGTLDYLALELRVDIPAEALTRLADSKVGNAERRAHAALAQPPSTRRSAAMAWWFWDRYRARAELDGKRPRPRDFLIYMQGFWGLDSPGRVPGHALRRLWRERDEGRTRKD